ncbi:hypothetical protein Ahy_B03g061815 [Arachis hypogaea]|uniref:Uncharacterized protein n=1 Tax=Arachis hypogaea TaxID=3818 RepID=A0A444ZS10_ARAHY|nr:hypothetical protein Ahy_B03g061815 [Arachis hypogaea]
MALRSMIRSAMALQPLLPRPCIHHSSLTPIHIASRRFRPPQPPTSCSHHESTPSHDHQEPPPQQPSEVSKSGGAHAGYDEWLALDQKVNSYPSVRGFTAIGIGGDDFVQAMVLAVQSVIQHPIPQLKVPGLRWLTHDWDLEMILVLQSLDECAFEEDFTNAICLICITFDIMFQGCVKQKSSSGGKYVSVNIGPIEVVSSEQVQAVYNAMRRDDRMKYFF